MTRARQGHARLSRERVVGCRPGADRRQGGRGAVDAPARGPGRRRGDVALPPRPEPRRARGRGHHHRPRGGRPSPAPRRPTGSPPSADTPGRSARPSSPTRTSSRCWPRSGRTIPPSDVIWRRSPASGRGWGSTGGRPSRPGRADGLPVRIGPVEHPPADDAQPPAPPEPGGRELRLRVRARGHAQRVTGAARAEPPDPTPDPGRLPFTSPRQGRDVKPRPATWSPAGRTAILIVRGGRSHGGLSSNWRK